MGHQTWQKIAVLLLAPFLGGAGVSEIAVVRFVCTSPGAVLDVIRRSDDLIIGLSPLPSGCAWQPMGTTGRIGQTLFYVDGPGGRVARVSPTEVDTQSGFSAGLVELLS